MNYLISYATGQFLKSQKQLEKSAYRFNIDKVINYSDNNIKGTQFYIENQHILDQKRGSGYWLWKPYLILETLKKIQDNDYLIYSDAGIEIIEPLDILFKLCEENKGILLFDNSNLKNSEWTKRDCFILMGLDSPEYANGEQITASFICLKKNEFILSLVQEWLNFCCNPNILTDIPNTCEEKNYSGFRSHRHDQSVLSLLAIKYKIELYRDPSRWGNSRKLPRFRKFFEFIPENKYLNNNLKLNSPYGTLINHHRNLSYDFPKIRFKTLFMYLNRNKSTFTDYFKY